MTHRKKIEELLIQAMEHYNSGRYHEAIEIWERVLREDSSNKEAREGLRMAELIAKSWLPEHMDSQAHMTTDESTGEEDAQEAIDEQKDGSLEEQAEDKEDTEEDQEDSDDESDKVESTDEKVHEMIIKAEGLIKEKRYVEAIDQLSEAWALDESNGAIQDLMNIARSLLEMENKKIKEKWDEAIKHYERKEWEAAEILLKEIVSINPGHKEALSYLERINQEKSERTGGKAPSEDLETGEEEEVGTVWQGGDVLEGESPYEQNLNVEEEELHEIERTLMEGGRKGLSTKILLVCLSLLILGSGWYFSRDLIKDYWWSKTEKKDEAPRERLERVDKARGFASGGYMAQTSGTDHKERMADSANEERTPKVQVAPEQKEGQGSEAEVEEEASMEESLSPEERERKVKELLRKGSSLMASGQLSQAKKKFKEAMILDPLSFKAKRLFDEAARMVEEERKRKEKKAKALKFFNEGNFEEALKIFYRLPQSDREPIQRYILNSWYNLGLFYLMAGNVAEAGKCFNEVLEIRPNDREALREKKMADWYSSHRKDESFYSHIKALTYRKLTE